MFAIVAVIFGFIFDAATAIADFIALTVWPFILTISAWVRTAWSFLRPVWDDVVKPTIQWVHDLYSGLVCWVQDNLAPVLSWVKKVSDFTKLIYQDVIKPVIAAFTAVRHVLDILKALHVPWAAALENDLNALESKFLGPILDVINTVNQVAAIIDGLILDPAGLLFRSTILGSLWRDQRYVLRLVFADALRNPYQPRQPSTDSAHPLRAFPVYVDTVVQGFDGIDPDGGDLIAMAEASFDDFINA